MSDPASQDLRALLREPAESWARDELGLAEAAGEDDLRRAMLRRLRNSNFTPPPPSDQAIRMLADPAAELRADDYGGIAFLAPFENHLHVQMSRFAREFFELPPEARRETWERLYAVGQFSPTLIEHLLRLKPALDVRLSETKDSWPRAQWLIDLNHASFCAPPPMRAGIEGLILAQVAAHPDAWLAAAKRLRKTRPDLAAIGVPLLRAIEVQAKAAGAGPLAAVRRVWNATWQSAGTRLVAILVSISLFGVISDNCRLDDKRHTRRPPPVIYQDPARAEQARREANRALEDRLKQLSESNNATPGAQP